MTAWFRRMTWLPALVVALTPLLGGADGGCGPASIGGDDPDSGTGGAATGVGGSVGEPATDAGDPGPGPGTGGAPALDAGPIGTGGVPALDAGSPQGTPCGPVTCGPGLLCCDAACGRCVRTADECSLVDCAPCVAQDARGEGPCDAFLGYAWSGTSCVSVSGCQCVGTECASLWGTREACEAAYTTCDQPPVCQTQKNAVVEYLQRFQSCQAHSHCQTVHVGCVPAEHCSGAFYVNREIDPAQLQQLQAALNLCVNGDSSQGCGLCEAEAPPAACNAGVCGAAQD